MSTKTVKGRWGLAIVLSLTLLAFGSLWMNIDRDQEALRKDQVEAKERLRVYEESVGALHKASLSAKTEEDWSNVRTLAQKLPASFESAKIHFTRLADARTIELKSLRREALLRNAGELLAVNKNDPEVKRRVAEAKQLHEDIALLLSPKQIGTDPKNPEWNKALAYRKGYEEYRSLAYIAEDEHAKAADIIAGAIAHFAKALEANEKDVRTEYAIEFLYKRAKEEDSKSGAAQAGLGRVRGLPAPGRAGPGNGDTDRPRRH